MMASALRGRARGFFVPAGLSPAFRGIARTRHLLEDHFQYA